MKELIKVTTDPQGGQLVSARDLYAFLMPSTRFDKWISRMLEYGFSENADYQRLDKIGQTPNGGKRVVLDDYALTLDTAKEISMLQRTDKGKAARQYFIACEKQLKESLKPMTIEEMIIVQAQSMIEAKKRITAV